MPIHLFLPDSRALRCEEVKSAAGLVAISVTSSLPSARCPRCDQPSSRIHSRYLRKLQDLPWQGTRVQIHWRNRRFFCDQPRCPQRIFTERLPEVASSYARKTARMVRTFRWIGFSCGGEGGARLADRLGMPTSPDSLLRIIRKTPAAEAIPPRVLGVDDWAFRRGQRYGTILCDLERHRVVDLLPERSSESFQAWLQTHPGVEIISRDRGDYYIKGATAGAPKAIQVADRWHLLSNLRKALTRIADRHPQQLLVAARALQVTREAVETPPAVAETSPSKPGTENNQPSQGHRRRRYEQVMELHRQGLSQREIARRLGIYRGTVGRYVHADGFPERARRSSGGKTDRFMDSLWQRWQEGCHNAVELTEELRRQGFKGSYYAVKRRVAAWRHHESTASSTVASRPPPALERTSSHRIAWLLLKPGAELLDDELALVDSVTEHCPPLKTASALAKRFGDLLRQRRANELDGWIEEATRTGVAEELRRFAKGLKADLAAVQAAFSLPWSNGQTEGHVNRLKLIKRQMFGRAKFDLLRQRVIENAA